MGGILTITDPAAEKLRAFARARPAAPTTGVRLDVIGGAQSGFAYDFFFDDRESTDEVIVTNGIRLLVRPDCVPYLDGAVIDWVESDNGAGFQIRNPNEPPK